MRTLFEELGGADAIEAIADLHYEKVVADPSLAPFFDGLDMAIQKRKFRAFLHTVTGGQLRRSDLELRATHSRVVDQGMESHHVDLFLAHLGAALAETQASPEVADRVIKAVEQKRDHVLGK
jgi:hemoglobin